MTFGIVRDVTFEQAPKMKITRAFKVELDPNNVQRTAMLKHCGAARFAYNWGLARKKAQRDAGAKQSGAFQLSADLRKVIDVEFPWMREVSSRCREGALDNLDIAYKNFFARCKKGKTGKATGFPQFKSRKNGLGGFVDRNYTVEANHVRLTRIGRVRLKESGYIPLGGYTKNTESVRFYGARVTERAGRWYLAVQVEIETPEPRPGKGVVGVDAGIKCLATCSDGLEFQNPKATARFQKKLRRQQRAMSRKFETAKREGRPLRECKNFQKDSRRVAIIHAKISNLRTHHLHHASHVITRKSSVIGVESLNVSGMMKNRRLAKAVADASMSELLRQIQYKALRRGGTVIAASRWFASSKMCNGCGAINAELRLSQRAWTCGCGARNLRDMNAANNLRDLAANQAVSACGGEGSGKLATVCETNPIEAGIEQGALLAYQSQIPGEPGHLPKRVKPIRNAQYGKSTTAAVTLTLPFL